MNRLDALSSTRYYFVHGEGKRTIALLGRQAMSRAVRKSGMPAPGRATMHIEYFDMAGVLLKALDCHYGPDEEFFIDSVDAFGIEKGEKKEGSVVFKITDLDLAPGAVPPTSLNGFFLIHDAGRFVTGVHMYHDLQRYSGLRRLRFYAKRAVLGLKALFDKPWGRDAIAGSVVHSGDGRPFYIMHSDDDYPGTGGFLECRGENGSIERTPLAALPAGGTTRTPVAASPGWSHTVCALPPIGVGRILIGESFPDGTFCVDHTYFQQPGDSTDTKVVNEVRYFKKSLLSESMVGPSNPWPCVHGDGVETLIAVPNQYKPEVARTYDVLVFDENGRLALRMPAGIKVPPFGVTVLNVSEELSKRGIERLQGTYLVCHSREADAESLPNRIHLQTVHRFGGRYWNASQGDAHVWATPAKPSPEMEALTGVKIRRRQLWYSPVVESDTLETVIVVANLSYDLNYNETQRIRFTYCEGDKELASKELDVPPHGCVMPLARDLFGDVMTARAGFKRGIVTVSPVTGKTFCGSLFVRDRASGVFMIEHFMLLPKFPNEN